MITNLRTILKNNIVAGIKAFQKLVDYVSKDENIHLVSRSVTQEQLQDLQVRLNFYLPGRTLETHSHLPLFVAMSSQAVLLFGEYSPLTKKYGYYRDGIFDVDHQRNQIAGWAWIHFVDYCVKRRPDISLSYCHFKCLIDLLRKQHLIKTYVFGTGPSLSEAGKMDWSDGYRIVCNTIVRDADLWTHINPHVIVAGDAIYHFSYTEFACAFRKDLKQRLSETQTYFAYPSFFHEIVSREFDEFEDRLIPIPYGTHTKIFLDLEKEFSLPKTGNVLPLLLLPLACTLSKNIFLWGFDGRGPNDELFWANSAKHSYPELLPELRTAFPAFFDYFVPAGNESKYVNIVHGDILDQCLHDAEKEGWSFDMMHKSWTPTLQKRCSMTFQDEGS